MFRHVSIWMNLKNITLSERARFKKWPHLGVPGWRSWLSVRLQPGHDLAVCEFEPRIRLWADRSEPGACFRFCVSLSLWPSPVHALSLSVPKINKRWKKFFLKWPHLLWFYLEEMYRKGHFIETGSRQVVACGWGRNGNWLQIDMGSIWRYGWNVPKCNHGDSYIIL